MDKLGTNGKRIRNDKADHIMNLITIAFFWCMRSCKYVIALETERTITIWIRDIFFRTRMKEEIDHEDPDLLEKVWYTSINFADQKNSDRIDKRTHEGSEDPILCPCLKSARAVMRVIKFVKMSIKILVCVKWIYHIVFISPRKIP